MGHTTVSRDVVLITGSNQGDKARMLREAARLAVEKIGAPVAQSSVFESEPWGFAADELFLNQVLVLRSSLETREILQKIQAIETSLGRTRSSQERYSSRSIDIDILFHGDLVIDEPGLHVPHPRMTERRFVLEPLEEVLPHLLHPILHKTVRQLLEECRDPFGVRRFRPA